MLNGMLQNQQDVNKLMEDVKAAMQTLQQFMAQMNPTEQQMQQPPQPEVKEVAEKGEMPTILTQPPQPEPDKVGIQGRPKEQEVQPPHERLAAEKHRMEGVKNWRQTITNALLSHEDGREMREYLHSLREDATHHSTALSCIAFGVVRGASADQANKQSVMDALLNGQSIGRQNNGLLNKSMEEYNYAAEQLQVNNREPMEKMLTEAVMALSYQASRESSLSPRHTMIARLISNAFRIADSNGLNLPLSNDERTFVKGAQELGKLAQKYQAAREYLSKDTKDLNSPEGRNAVCDLLAGNTVEKMLREEQQNPRRFPMSRS
jgi:hypothetical protein